MTKLLRGTMLTPGVSKNGRLYTPENIRNAYRRLQERLAEGTRPVAMLTHHAAGDDSRLIVGRVTSVAMRGNDLDYTAALANTKEAATIGDLLEEDEDGQSYLRNVSIRGWWIGQTSTVDGCETADDIEIDGLDFTKSPGVTGATVELVPTTATTESTGGRVLISESVEARVFTETVAEATSKATKAPYGDVQYADPGYQTDKKKRYPLDTKARAKAAWSYINQADNAKLYSAAQLKRVRGRIKAALKKFGVQTTTESLAVIAETAPEVLMLESANTTLSECYACVQDGTGTAGFSISAYNGPLTVSVSAYNGVEPADLGSVAMAAMQAACDAIHALDLDDDGDIDAGADSDASEGRAPDDNRMESAQAPAAATAAAENEATAAVVAETHEEEAMAEEASATTEGAATEAAPNAQPPAPAIDYKALAEALVEAQKTADAAAAGATESAASTEAGGAVDETGEGEQPDPNAELRETIRQDVIKEALASGVITRKGLVESGTLGDAPKPLHEMNEEEWRAYQAERAGVFFAHDA